MSNLKNKSRTTADKENDEVEELLRAAEEDVFLKLSLNSHTLHGSSSQTIHPDLDRRFHALKSNHKSQPHPPPKTQQINTSNDDDADLLGRFEALKKTLPSYQNHGNEERLHALGGCDDEEEEDEVEKVIRWAKDAARLDPSPVSDTDEDQEKEEEEESDDDYDSEEDDVKKHQKGNKSKSKRK